MFFRFRAFRFVEGVHLSEKKRGKKCKENMQAIQDQLTEINNAGKAMAEEQYPLYIEKQNSLREKYRAILNTDNIKTDEEKAEEKKKLDSMTKEKADAYLKEQRSKKHVMKMTKSQREKEISNIMRSLYFGIDTIDVPSDFHFLVNTGIPTMDAVNHYNIVLAMQTYLKKDHPDTFCY